MKKKIIILVATLLFTFIFYFKGSINVLWTTKFCFYKDIMFYVALLIAFLFGFIFTRFISFEKKEHNK